MSIPLKEKIISLLEAHFKVKLVPVKGKRIFYQGVLSNKKDILVCTPQTKLHTTGFGWIDLTTIQVELLQKAVYGVLAVRMEGNLVYYMHFSSLKKYLTANTMLNNNSEGDLWRLYIWPDYIEVRGNKSLFKIQPNNFNDL